MTALDYHIFSSSEAKAKEKRIESPAVQQLSSKEHQYVKYMYCLPSTTSTKPEQVFATVSSHTNYDATYKLLCDLLDFAPSGGMTHKINPFFARIDLFVTGATVDDYLFYTLWQLLQQLPPSPQFLGSLKDPNLFQAKVRYIHFFDLWVLTFTSSQPTLC